MMGFWIFISYYMGKIMRRRRIREKTKGQFVTENACGAAGYRHGIECSTCKCAGAGGCGRAAESDETVMRQGEPPTLGTEVFGNWFGEEDQRCGFVQNNTQGIHVPAGAVQGYKDEWTDYLL